MAVQSIWPCRHRCLRVWPCRGNRATESGALGQDARRLSPRMPGESLVHRASAGIGVAETSCRTGPEPRRANLNPSLAKDAKTAKFRKVGQVGPTRRAVRPVVARGVDPGAVPILLSSQRARGAGKAIWRRKMAKNRPKTMKNGLKWAFEPFSARKRPRGTPNDARHLPAMSSGGAAAPESKHPGHAADGSGVK